MKEKKLVHLAGKAASDFSNISEELPPWLMLVVDDDPDVIAITKLNLRGFILDGRSLHLISASSASKAKNILLETSGIAVALIDVVMETDDAGLQLVKFIRDELGNKQIQIIIRTGQAGRVPERYIIDNFDINDYKEKSELSSQKLYTTVRTSLKSYRDLVNLKVSEASLMRSEAHFRTLFESSKDAVMLLDEIGFFDCNAATLDMFGCVDKAEFCCLRIVDISPPMQPLGGNSFVLGNQHIATALSRGSHHFEWFYRRIDGHDFPAEVLFSVMFLEGRTVVQSVVRDISERKEAEARVNLAMEEAESANRAKTNFLAVISHEIRTPMHAMLGMSELLLETDLNADQRNFINTLYQSGQGLMLVINDLIDFSSIEAGRIHLEDMLFSTRRVLESAAHLMRMVAIEKGLSLVVWEDSEIPEFIMGDIGRVRQVLINLLGNAVKFTNHGQVDVRLSRYSDEDGMLLFQVVDTGIGISQEDMESIFEQFAQADAGLTRRYGGTGLGLAISRRLVELMGGRIWVESQLGQGSAFSFTIPMRIAQSPFEQDSHPELVDISNTRCLNILLVEDVPFNQMLINAYLIQSSHKLAIVTNGTDAVGRVQEENFDVVIMDVQMPMMDGYTATRHIRQWEREQGRTPMMIIALTAHAIEGEMERSQEAGCDLFLTKPISKKKLMEVLQQIANKTISFAPPIPMECVPAESAD